MFWVLALYLDFEDIKTTISFKSWYGPLEDTGCSWLGFWILILIWIWSLVLDTTMFWVLALYLHFEDIKTSISFKLLYQSLEDTGGSWLKFGILSWFGYGHWSLVTVQLREVLPGVGGRVGIKKLVIAQLRLSQLVNKSRPGLVRSRSGSGSGLGPKLKTVNAGVWDFDLDLDMVTGLWHTYVPNFGYLSWFWRCKEHPCPLSPHLGLWRTLEVPDWGLTSCSWFGFCHESCLDLPWKFQHAQISKS